MVNVIEIGAAIYPQKHNRQTELLLISICVSFPLLFKDYYLRYFNLSALIPPAFCWILTYILDKFRPAVLPAVVIVMVINK